MDINSIISFIKRGSNLETNLLRQCAIGAGLFFLFPLYWKLKYKGIPLGITIAMQIISFVAIITLYILTAGQRTIKKRLLIHLILPLYLIINLLLFATIAYKIIFELQLIVFFLYLPPVLTSIIMLSTTVYMLKKGAYSSKIISINNLSSSFAFTGISGVVIGLFGMRIGETFFKNASPTTVIVFLISSFVFMASIFSISINNILKLYYMHKLKNMGIDVNENVTPGVVYLPIKTD